MGAIERFGRMAPPSEIDAGKIAADFILILHGHGTHVADLVAIAKRTGATVIAPSEVGSWF